MSLACELCLETYDLEEHRPKSLPCDHTFCISCINNLFSIHGCIHCPIDRELIWNEVAKLADNRALITQLQSLEVRCLKHKDFIAKEVCLPHMTIICKNCSHLKEGCVNKTIAENYQEISGLLCMKIEEMMKEVPSSSLTPSVKDRDNKKFSSTLSENFKLLSDLETLKRSLTEVCCSICNGAPGLFDSHSFDAYCKKCMMSNEELIELDGDAEQTVRRVMCEKILNVLRDIHFFNFSVEVLQFLDVMREKPSKEVQMIAKKLLPYRSERRPSCEELPERFLCPSCKQLLSKATNTLYILRCRALHAICEECVNQWVGQEHITCPLDKSEYKMKIEALEKFVPPPRIPVSVPIPSPVANVREPQKFVSHNFFRPMYSTSSFASDGPNGTALPNSQLLCDFQAVERFLHVLPSFGTTSSRQSGENKGWMVNAKRRQVEGITIQVFDDVLINGICLGNPIDQGVTATVESISFYRGSRANVNSAVIYIHNYSLTGGNSIFTDILFDDPFSVSAFVEVTMKIKWRSGKPFYVYRGNPFTRPEVWTGTDDLVWEFMETKDVEPDEIIVGQNSGSGPILRFYYTRQLHR